MKHHQLAEQSHDGGRISTHFCLQDLRSLSSKDLRSPSSQILCPLSAQDLRSLSSREEDHFNPVMGIEAHFNPVMEEGWREGVGGGGGLHRRGDGGRGGSRTSFGARV